MKKLVMGVLTGFLFAVVASQVSYADQCECGRETGMQRGPQRMHHGHGFMEGSRGAGHFLWKKLMRLGLTEKQTDALKAIKSRVTKDTIKKSADLALARVELRELLHKDQVDMSAVEASLKKTESVKTDLKLTHIRAMEEMKAILTPEQRKKLKEDIKAGFMMREGKCGHRKGSRPAVRKDEAQHGAEGE